MKELNNKGVTFMFPKKTLNDGSFTSVFVAFELLTINAVFKMNLVPHRSRLHLLYVVFSNMLLRFRFYQNYIAEK